MSRSRRMSDKMIFCSRLVIKTLKETDQERKCFRLVGGVLLEKTVKDVVPTLETSVQGVSSC